MHVLTASDSPHLTIGRIASLADISANAVRFYEREGLMVVPAKSSSGYRLYGLDAVARLRFIKQAQRCGFTLGEIQDLLRVRGEASSCCDDVRSKVIEKKLQMESRIKEMRAMSKELDRLIADCVDVRASAQDCSILASLSAGTERPQ